MTRHLPRIGFPLGSWFAAVLVASAFATLAAVQAESDAVRAFAPATVIEGKPQERGRAYGAQFREAIRDFLAKEIDAAFFGKPSTKEQMRQYAAACGKVVRAECPLVADEFQGIAAGAGLTFDEIVLINLHEELYHRTDLPKHGHCTAVAVGPPDTGDGHAYVGQTWDWMQSVAGKSCVLEWRRDEGVSVLAYGFPGMPMGAGMNAKGIALCWTSANLGNKGQTPRVGIPSYMLIAHLLAQEDLDSVLREARKNKHAGWFTFVLADGHGRLVNIEGSPERVVVEEADGRLARVMYGSRELAGGKLHARCQLMYDLLRETQGKNNLTRLQDYFADPKYKINVGKGTIDMMVFDTTARTARFSRGTSYNASWREYVFGASHVQDAGNAESAQARAVIDKAVQAHGGADKLGRFKAVSAKWVGKHRIENEHYGDAVRFVTYEMPTNEMPVKIRFDFEVENPKGNHFAFSRVVHGKQGWQGAGQRTRDLKEAEITFIVDEMHAHWLSSVAPFQDVVPFKNNGFEFSVYGNVPADGKDAIGVVVSCKGRPDVIPFFDKETGLVIKSERRVKDPVTNREFTAESIYRDYKAFQGVMWPTIRLDRRDGEDLEENSGRFELSEFQALDKVDESSLARP